MFKGISFVLLFLKNVNQAKASDPVEERELRILYFGNCWRLYVHE